MSDSTSTARDAPHARDGILAFRARFGAAASDEAPRLPRWMLPLAWCFAIAVWLVVTLVVFAPDYATQAARIAAQLVAHWTSQVPQTDPPVSQWYTERFRADPDPNPQRPVAVVLVPPIPRNCDEARAMGLAPAYRGNPGYAPWLDGDNDGISCEPLPRWRRYRVYQR